MSKRWAVNGKWFDTSIVKRTLRTAYCLPLAPSAQESTTADGRLRGFAISIRLL